MKIGILTMNSLHNYGGLLQGYALQKYIERQGHHVELINYQKTSKNPLYWKLLLYISKLTIQSIKYCYSNKKHNSSINKSPYSDTINKKFIEFRKKMRYSHIVDDNNINTYVLNYDLIIVGSDQVWGYLYDKKLTFFLDFLPTQAKRISYAACSPTKYIPFFQKKKIQLLLNKFSAISVRDNTTLSMISQLKVKTPTLIVVDPTMLISFDECTAVKQISSPYILVYILGNEISGGSDKVRIQLKKKYNNIPIVAVEIPFISEEAKKIADIIIKDASPEEWLSLIKYATFVFTDSFHGILFSIKSHIDFIGYYSSESRASRLIDLQKDLALPNIVKHADEACKYIETEAPINYCKVDQMLKIKIKESQSFLRTYL